MYAIETKGLTKHYKDVVAVNGLDISVNDGELFALLGVNGAGKTTAIKMLCGLSEIDGGSAFINGYNVATEKANVKRIIGVSPQETAIAPNLTVKENLELICGLHGFSKEKCVKRVDELIDAFKLFEVTNKRAAKLSGGWQRRLSIAMALISEPEVLFLDEPTLGLDVIARSELWDMIRSLKGKITVILTTHYMEEAEALSDRIGIMKDGKLLVVGTAQELMDMTNADKFENAFISIVREATV